MRVSIWWFAAAVVAMGVAGLSQMSDASRREEKEFDNTKNED